MSRSKLKKIDVLRITGNLLTLAGYAVLLYIDPATGSGIKVLGLCLALPSCIQLKLWDVVFMLSLFGALDLANLIRLSF